MSADEVAALIPPAPRSARAASPPPGRRRRCRPPSRSARSRSACGVSFKVSMLTGASTGPELDGLMGLTEAVGFRFRTRATPSCATRSTRASNTRTCTCPTSAPSSATATTGRWTSRSSRSRRSARTACSCWAPRWARATYLEMADRLILEVNSWVDERYEGVHDVFGVSGRHGEEIPVYAADSRWLAVRDDRPEEGRRGRRDEQPRPQQPVQGAGRGPPADRAPHPRLPRGGGPLRAPAEDAHADPVRRREHPERGALRAERGAVREHDRLHRAHPGRDGGHVGLGQAAVASASAVTLSPERQVRYRKELDRYRKQIVLRPQEISNNPEVIRRLGCIAMNGFIEADIYGHVNSTHIVGRESRTASAARGTSRATRRTRSSCPPRPPATGGSRRSCRSRATSTPPSTT